VALRRRGIEGMSFLPMPFRHAGEALRHRVTVLEDELRDRDRELARLSAPPRRAWTPWVAGVGLLGIVGAAVALLQSPAEAATATWIGGSLRLVDVDGDGRAEPTGFVPGPEGPASVVLDAGLAATSFTAEAKTGPAEVATVPPPRFVGYDLPFALQGAEGHIVALGHRGAQPVVLTVEAGEVRWVRTLPAPAHRDRSVVHARRVVVAIPGDDETKVFAFTLGGDVAWTHRLEGPPHRLRGTEGRIFVEHGGHLTALDATTGHPVAQR